MRKHDDGYILVYVMVVLLVFCLVAATILTAAHRNLQNQQKTIEKMKDQYAAVGMIEQVLSDWSAYKLSVDANQKIEAMDGALVIEKTEDDYSITATKGAIQIICVVDGNGKYVSYDIGTYTPDEAPPAAEREGEG